MRIPWKKYFMLMAKTVASRSTCNSRPSGAIIVLNKRILTTGFTGTVPGKPQCSDQGEKFCYRRSIDAPEIDKYNHCPSIHAEQNAIVQAVRTGINILGSEMYCTLAPCYICLKMIAGAGIVKVYYELEYKSQNEERDLAWSNFNKVDIVGEQVEISEEDLKILNSYLIGKTSERRL